MLLSQLLTGQYRNLDKLPPEERNPILIRIANEAIEKFSVGYLRPGNQPYIEDIGFKLNELYNKSQSTMEYVDRYFYAVYYLPTEEEKAFYKEDYLVKALILADVGKVTEIMYIDDDGHRRFALEKSDPDSPVRKRKFKTVKEYLEMLERTKPKVTKIVDYTPTPEMQKFLDMQKRKRDSFRILRQQYLRRRDSIWKADSIRCVDSLRRVDSIRGAGKGILPSVKDL